MQKRGARALTYQGHPRAQYRRERALDRDYLEYFLRKVRHLEE